jgi:hypothetical protein
MKLESTLTSAADLLIEVSAISFKPIDPLYVAHPLEKTGRVFAKLGTHSNTCQLALILPLHREEVNCATRRIVVQTLIFAVVIRVRTLVTDISVAQGLPVHWECLSVRSFQPCNAS